jgi:hypothetical protein
MADDNEMKVSVLQKPAMRRHGQSGYTMLMVVFMVATMIIFATVVAPNLLTQGRRERETEMVWRGEQYERAIGLYYRKFGKYPTKIEDLTKQTNGVRFLRQAYNDPMNKDDGSWRFIYVGPNGQLIGSVRHSSVLQALTPPPTALSGASSLSGPGSGLGAVLSGALQPSNSPNNPPGGAPTPGSGTTGPPGAPSAGQPGTQTNGAPAPDSLESQPQPLEGAVIGGNIIGIGSKIQQPSIRVYEGGDTYQQWEFIWNPTQMSAIPGQNSVNPVVPTTQTPTQAPGQTPQVPAVNPPPAQ